VSADLTNAAWSTLGHPEIGRIEAAEAGRRLARLAGEHDFVLFEYWKTDHAGHSQNMREAVEALENFDGFLVGILEGLDANGTLLLMTSDHGNIEDMSTKTHTRNPVPLVLYGAGHAGFARELDRAGAPDLTHITPFILRLLGTD
jgi:bisphosphoglycerate-independent phosphoglycerate mutase (AlkP superfamily)